jgi:hypothetical protein
MLKRALWLGVAVAASVLSFATFFSPAGCQSTCATTADCGSGSYCSTAVGICLSAEALGFCRDIPTTCPDVVEPVCGCDGMQYQNQCEAAKAGVSVSADGTCSTSCGGPSVLTCSDKTTYCHFADVICGAGNAVGTCDPIPASCTNATPLTVCGCDGKTYASRCDAQAAGTSVNTLGPCPCGGPAGTACEAGKYCQFTAGTCTTPDPAGTCVTVPAAGTCSAFSSPVCGCDGKTYDNACVAAEQKISVAATGLCPCGGPGGVTCAATEFCSYPTTTSTAGLCLTPGNLGTCEPRPTVCAPVTSPVCGCDGVNYDNPCQAALAGTSVGLMTACPVPDGG